MSRARVRRVPGVDPRAYATGAGLGVLKPSPSTTGVLPAISRTALSGNQTITTAGTTLQNRDISGRVDIRAANVTIRNCTMAALVCTNVACSNALIEDCTIRPLSESYTNGAGVVGHDFTMRRTVISGFIDGFNIHNTNLAPADYDTNVLIEHTWVNKMAWWTASTSGLVHTTDTWSHNDGIQHFGGWGTTMRGSLIDASLEKQYGHWQATDPSAEPYTSIALNSLADGGPWWPLPDRGTGTEATGRYNSDATSPGPKTISLSGFLINNSQGVSRELVLTDNWWYGGDFGFNGGGFNRGTETNQLLTFTGNRFDHSQGNQGAGGDDTFTLAGFGSGWGSFITRSNNIYEDTGTPITERIP